MSNCDVSRDVSPSPVTITAENARLTTLVSALREENEAAHQLLRRHRLFLISTKKIMERRIPAHITKAKVRNTCDKATIKVIVAELDKLERIYSPHMTPAGNDGRVRGSLCAQADIPGLGEERGRTSGSLPAKTDVPGPEMERGRTTGPLHDKADVPGPGQQGERTTGSLRDKADVPGPQEERGRNDGSLRGDEVDVLRLRQERGHTNGSLYPAVDWDNVARLSLTREKDITLSMPRTTPLPVHACSPTPILHPDEYPHPNEGLRNDAYVQRKEEIRQEMEMKRLAAQKTYNPVGGSYRPPEKDAIQAPFGAIMGFRTSLGPISFPKGPVKGYIWDQDHSWVLFASPPGVRRRGARGQRR